MQAQSKDQVYFDIKSHIDIYGGKYFDWYVGITSDWKGRLFNSHQVPNNNYWFIARQCYTTNDARNVEGALCLLGCDNGIDGGDENTVYVYAYLKGTVTTP